MGQLLDIERTFDTAYAIEDYFGPEERAGWRLLCAPGRAEAVGAVGMAPPPRRGDHKESGRAVAAFPSEAALAWRPLPDAITGFAPLMFCGGDLEVAGAEPSRNAGGQHEEFRSACEDGARAEPALGDRGGSAVCGRHARGGGRRGVARE